MALAFVLIERQTAFGGGLGPIDQFRDLVELEYHRLAQATGKPRMGHRVARVQLNRALEHFDALTTILGSKTMVVILAPQEHVIGIQAFGRSFARVRQSRRLHLPCQSGYQCRRNFILQHKHVLEFPIEAISPQV